MPNGGVPYGCWACKHSDTSGVPVESETCTLHKIEVNMDLICNDIDYGQSLGEILEKAGQPNYEDTLFIWIHLMGYEGYPPPMMLAPLGLIEDYRHWTDEEKKEAIKKAEVLARHYYEKWRSQQ